MVCDGVAIDDVATVVTNLVVVSDVAVSKFSKVARILGVSVVSEGPVVSGVSVIRLVDCMVCMDSVNVVDSVANSVYRVDSVVDSVVDSRLDSVVVSELNLVAVSELNSVVDSVKGSVVDSV